MAELDGMFCRYCFVIFSVFCLGLGTTASLVCFRLFIC